MRREYCGAVTGLLASAGLALCLSSPGFAQAPAATRSVANENPETAARDPGYPVDFAAAPLSHGAAEQMSLDFGDHYQPSSWYGGAEYLLWWFKDNPLPAPLLTTTSNLNAMPVAVFNDSQTGVLIEERHSQDRRTELPVGGR